MPRFVLSAVVVFVLGSAGGCDLDKFTVKTTGSVLLDAQVSLEQESDFDTARAAIPGVLKTVEGFWVVRPEDQHLLAILTEGYCQYGAAFIEDDWDEAHLTQKFDEEKRLDAHATKAFTRCLNYALLQLGPRWQKDLFGQDAVVAKLIADATAKQRTPMMWAALAIGSIINHNKGAPAALAYEGVVSAILDKVIELDKTDGVTDQLLLALPHFALGALNSATGAQTGGHPDVAMKEFQTALDITHGRMMLAHVYWAFYVGKGTNDRKMFHDHCVQVLSTDPAIWPEQRLANEVARRRARRYLSHEKNLF
jgi:hypothetical protein